MFPLTEAERPVGTLGMEMAEVPLPLNGTVALTVPTMFKLALRPPTALGVKRTMTVQDAPTAMVPPLAQVPVAAFEKSPELVPVIVKYGVESTSEAVPTFETVTVTLALVVPVFWLPKFTAVGLGLKTGAVVAANWNAPIAQSVAPPGRAIGVREPPSVVSFAKPASAPLQETMPLQRFKPTPTTGEAPDSGAPVGPRFGEAF